MNILGVKIDSLSRKEILGKIAGFLNEKKFHQIATVNPEFILRAQKDAGFKNILNQCDLNVADGVGIWFAYLRFGKYLKTRIAGIDLMQEILKMANEKNLSIFLVANSGGLSSWEETAEAIRKIYPDLEISGANIICHSEFVEESTQYKASNILLKVDPSASLRFAQDDIKKISTRDIIFCSFGAPEQEKFLYSLKALKSGKIKLAMGVGGSFDYLTGKVRRAPVFMRKFGLEWFWRLILKPQYRFKRILNAVIIFPLKVLFSKTAKHNG